MTEAQYEITKRVYEKYPKTEKEFSCNQERQRLMSLRLIYKQRLESEQEKAHSITHKPDELL
jgi:hypothetical protein